MIEKVFLSNLLFTQYSYLHFIVNKLKIYLFEICFNKHAEKLPIIYTYENRIPPVYVTMQYSNEGSEIAYGKYQWWFDGKKRQFEHISYWGESVAFMRGSYWKGWKIVWCDNNVLPPHFPHNVRFVTRFPNNGKLNNAHSQLISLVTFAALRLWGLVLFRSLSPITDGFYGFRNLKSVIFIWKRWVVMIAVCYFEIL